jgi:hypothetical protein
MEAPSLLPFDCRDQLIAAIRPTPARVPNPADGDTKKPTNNTAYQPTEHHCQCLAESENAYSK